MEKNVLKQSNDAVNAGRLLPEVTGFSFFRPSGNESAVNGFKFDVRVGDQTYSVKFYENNGSDQNESVDYLVEDPKHEDLIKDRHELIHAVQEQVLEQSVHISALLNDLK